MDGMAFNFDDISQHTQFMIAGDPTEASQKSSSRPHYGCVGAELHDYFMRNLWYFPKRFREENLLLVAY